MQGNTHVKASLSLDSPQAPAASAEATNTAATAASSSRSSTAVVAQVVPRAWCGKYAVGAEDFSQSCVGAKSLNTQKLKVVTCCYGCVVSCDSIILACR